MKTIDRNTIIMRCYKRGLSVKFIANEMYLTESLVKKIIKQELEKV